MSIKRVPTWVRWALLAVVIWCLWGVAIHPQFAKRIRATDQTHLDCDRQFAAIKERIGQAPTLMRGVDSCRHVLDSSLATYTTLGEVDRLTILLREAGERHGLTDLQSEPRLPDLLRASRSEGKPQSAEIRLDTIVVALSAHGGFQALGAWLDEIEHRPDFQTWISCWWHHGDEEEGVGFEGKALLLVLGGSVSHPATMNAGL